MRSLFLFFISLLYPISATYSQDTDNLAEVFGIIPDFSSIQISPDGDRIATLMNNDGQRILVTRSLTDLNLAPVGIPFDDGEFRWVRWVSNDRILVGVRYATKVRFGISNNTDFMSTRLASMNWDGSDVKMLYKINKRRGFQSQFQDTITDMLPDDPEHVMLSIDVDKVNERSVYKLNVITNDRELIQDSMKKINSWITDKNHIVRYGSGYDDVSRKNKSVRFAYYRKSENDDWVKLYEYDPREAEEPFTFVGFTARPNEIYIKQISNNGYRGLYVFDVDTNEITEVIIEPDEYDVRGVSIDKNGEVSGYTHRDHILKRVNYDDKGQKINSIFEKNFPGAEYLISSASKNGQRLIVRTESSTDPGSYFLVDLTENKVELLDYNYKSIDPSMLSTSKPVTFKASDGIEIHGYLTLPTNSELKENLPTVILPVWRQGQRFYNDFHYWPQFLVSNGYAVLQINYRGAGGYGQYYQNLGKGEMGRRIVQDVNEGTKWMIEQGYSNPDKVCLMGDTFGGYLALQTPIEAPDLYKCTVAHAPVTSFDRYLKRMKGMFGYNRIKNLITNNEWDLDEASPLFNIDKMNIPALVFHGEKDMSISVKHSRDYSKRMNKKKKAITYIEFEDADAYLSRQEHRTRFLRETGRFLEKHLK